jgi:hypothetical protein
VIPLSGIHLNRNKTEITDRPIDCSSGIICVSRQNVVVHAQNFSQNPIPELPSLQNQNLFVTEIVDVLEQHLRRRPVQLQ